MLPPQGHGKAYLEYEGRIYDGTPGSPLDVPESDARVLKANGWIPLMEVGAKRPFNPGRGERFLDLVAGAELVFDGFRWLDALTGNPA
ncbi:hypothetical protein [Mesoterricola sediminis]|nr:hypothetical protein [Mesoterricola sediminis]